MYNNIRVYNVSVIVFKVHADMCHIMYLRDDSLRCNILEFDTMVYSSRI